MSEKLVFDDAAFKAQLDGIYQKLWDAIPAPKPAQPALNWSVNNDSSSSVDLKEDTVTFSAGLLASLENEAQLAGLLALVLSNSRDFEKVREVWSDRLNQDLKDKSPEAANRLKKINVSTPSAVRWMWESGYDVQSLVTHIEQAKEKLSITGTDLQESFLIAVTATNEVLGRQDLVAPQKNLPTPTKGNAVDAKARGAGVAHLAELRAREQEILAENGRRWNEYDALDFAGKCNLLTWAVETLEKATPKQSFTEKDVAERIKALDLKSVSDKDRPHVENLIKAVISTVTPVDERLELNDAKAFLDQLRKKSHGKLFYDALVQAETGNKSRGSNRPLVGQGLKTLEEKIQQFIKAEDSEKIKELADEILQLAENYPLAEVGMYIRFSNFSWPEGLENAKDFIAPAWDKHVRIESHQVDKVLGMLGVASVDPRMDPAMKHPSVKPMPMDAGGKDIYIRDDGSIRAVAKKEKEAFVGAYSQKQAEQAHDFVKQVNWGELEDDFQGFIEKYSSHLNKSASLFKVNKGFSESDHIALKRIYPLEKQAMKLKPQVYSMLLAGVGKDGISAVPVQEKQVFLETFLQKAGEIRNPQFQSQFADFLKGELQEKELPANHPYLGAYLSLENVPDEQKFKALKNVSFWGWNAEERQREWQFPFMDKLGYSSENASFSNLETFLADNRENFTHAGFDAKEAMITYAAFDTLKQVDKISSLDEVRLIRDVGAELDYRQKNEFHEKAAGFVADYARNVLQSGDLHEQVALYRTLSSSVSAAEPFFGALPVLRKEFEEKFRSHVETKLAGSATEQEEARALLADLLGYQPEPTRTWSNEKAVYAGVNLNTDFGNWVADTFLADKVQAFVKEHGSGLNPQAGEQEHESAFIQVMNELQDRVLTQEFTQQVSPYSNQMNNAREYAAQLMGRMSGKKLGNVLLLQGGAAHALQERIDRLGRVKQAVVAIDRPQWKTGNDVLDSFIRTSRFSAQHRDEVKHFLVSDCSEDSAKRMVSYLLKTNSTYSNTPKERLFEQVKDAHEKFWEMGFDARTAAMTYVLDFKLGTDVKDAVREVTAYAIPRPHALASDRKQMLRARDITSAYVEACDVPKRAALLASMLVAGKPGGAATESHSVGQALNLILANLGPAGDKLRQAIESYPATPVDIKQELQGAKTEARDLSRNVIWNMVEKSNEDAPEPGQKIVRMGRVLGAGSYGVTVQALRADGEWVARTLLYEGVVAQAETQFDTMRKAMGILKERDAELARMLSPLVEQASHMLHIELDMALAEKQIKTAEQLYSTQTDGGERKPVSVQVGDREVRSFAAPFAGRGVSGSTYKDAKIVEGVHFLDLAKEAVQSRKQAGKDAEKTQAERDLEDVSASLLMLEASFLLRGLPIDHDRHGGQQCIQKIKENGKTRFEVGQFDFGALEMEMCNGRQKQMIGYALAGLMFDLEVKEKDFGKALQNAMRDIPRTAEEEAFMAQTQRGVLAWGNFVSGLGDDRNLGHILGALYNQGYIDADVEKAMRERLGKYADKAFDELKAKGEASKLKLDSKPPIDQFKKPAMEWPLREAPALGKGLDAVPLTDKQVRNIGIGTVAATAAAASAVAVNHHNKKQAAKAEEMQRYTPQEQAAMQEQKSDRKKTLFRRVVRVAGAVVSVAGMALIADAVVTGGKNTRNITGAVVGDKHARIFNLKNTAVTGAAVMGVGALATLLGGKGKNRLEPEQQDMQGKTWQQRKQQESAVAARPAR